MSTMTQADFINAVESNINENVEFENNLTTTENGAIAYKSTKSAIVDFFASAGALRTRSEDEIIELFTRAWGEDYKTAFKLLFYFRDVRGGQGERRLFRILLRWIAEHSSAARETLRKNISIVPEYGRWDDLFVLLDTDLRGDVIDLIDRQLELDLDSSRPSLLAKWLKSENASSVETRRIAKIIRQGLGMTPKGYRKTLSTLREKINIVERQMSANRWREIEYSRVPSRASMIYRNAFSRHDNIRYTLFLADVNSGKEKINASTLYPYDVVYKFLYDRNVGQNGDSTLETLWANLPDYVDNSDVSALVVADVSGSMYGLPMAVSISLAMYFAERAKGPYANKFITFSRRPEIQTIKGQTLFDKIRNLSRADWSMNTDIEAVFMKILQTAVKNNAPQEAMPTHLFVISDMEFDCATRVSKEQTQALFDDIRAEYQRAGYVLPKLIFWNVNSRHQQYPATFDQEDVMLVSGLSPSLFRQVLTGLGKSTMELIEHIVNSDRYQMIDV